MVVLKCHLSEDTFRKNTLPGIIYKICDHLKGEPAYKDGAIVVTDADEKGTFYITLGGDHNKEQLILDVTL